LAGFGIKQAQKNTSIDPFGRQISHNMGKVVFGDIKGKRTPVLEGGENGGVIRWKNTIPPNSSAGAEPPRQRI
jgi:hypothetical protein